MANGRMRKKRPRRPSRTRSHTASLVAGGAARSDPWEHLRQVVERHRRLVAAVEAHKPTRTAVGVRPGDGDRETTRSRSAKFTHRGGYLSVCVHP